MFGKIRYMAYSGCGKKFKIPDYIARVNQLVDAVKAGKKDCSEVNPGRFHIDFAKAKVEGGAGPGRGTGTGAKREVVSAEALTRMVKAATSAGVGDAERALDALRALGKGPSPPSASPRRAPEKPSRRCRQTEDAGRRGGQGGGAGVEEEHRGVTCYVPLLRYTPTKLGDLAKCRADASRGDAYAPRSQLAQGVAHRPGLLEGGDLVLLLQRQADVVEAVQQAVLAERVHVERNPGPVGAHHDLLFQIHLQLAARVASAMTRAPAPRAAGWGACRS